MSIPTAVFLDTNVFAGQQYNFSSTAIRTFIPAVQNAKLKLLLPDPTEREVKRQIDARSKEALDALNDARRKAPFLSKWEHFPRDFGNQFDTWNVRRIALNEWHGFLRQFDVVRLSYEGLDVQTVMNWYDASTPPFGTGKKRKEFPDAFAVAILDTYAKKAGVHIAVVSDDGDFKQACERFTSLMHFPSLPRLTELLLADPAKVAALRAAIEEDLDDIAAGAWVAAEDLRFYHYDDRYEVEQSRIKDVSIHDVSVVAIGDQSCTLTFEIGICSEHTLQWEDWDDEDRSGYSTYEDSVSNDATVSGTAKVQLDEKTRKVKEVTLLEIDEVEIELTESPRSRW
ncbi:hypothetical protein WI44_22310 [Burkholderia cepacia]|uniref:PIN domain-containing protein n=1 Tax=Burkholderia cepacia TaxID=292 RepID=UPI0007574FAC|nr:PIN domain-containing protein [Burkholderia cepacia]KVA29677.1 hypothetical protein WI44_22310 [Burkholderia cepacia]KVA41202.1 hypothetical protein WI45_18440 [Burkholderia cepacia]